MQLFSTHGSENRFLSGGLVVLNIVMLFSVMTALACGGGGGSSPTAPGSLNAGSSAASGSNTPIPADAEKHIQIEKWTNGEDADATPGPTIPIGATVTWTYRVTNLSSILSLLNIVVVDDQEGTVTCPESSLAVGEMMVCELTGVAQAGQYTNLATVSADLGDGTGNEQVSDSSNYFGDDPGDDPPPTGEEGCTPGYWKNNADKKGAVAWSPGYTPLTTLGSLGIVNTIGVDPSDLTMGEALYFGGGPDLEDWENRLLKHATAAILNAANAEVFYPWTVAEIIDEVNTALASDDEEEINGLKDELDGLNNLGCPINQAGER